MLAVYVIRNKGINIFFKYFPRKTSAFDYLHKYSCSISISVGQFKKKKYSFLNSFLSFISQYFIMLNDM